MFLSISFSFPTPLSKNKNKNAYLSDAKLSDLTPQPTPEGPWLCVHNCTQIPAWVGDGGGGGYQQQGAKRWNSERAHSYLNLDAAVS